MADSIYVAVNPLTNSGEQFAPATLHRTTDPGDLTADPPRYPTAKVVMIRNSQEALNPPAHVSVTIYPTAAEALGHGGEGLFASSPGPDVVYAATLAEPTNDEARPTITASESSMGVAREVEL